jgi:hypothetical protein
MGGGQWSAIVLFVERLRRMVDVKIICVYNLLLPILARFGGKVLMASRAAGLSVLDDLKDRKP